MNLQNLKLSMLAESKTNPRGNDFDGASFEDLVSSVREKGVLVPILVRLVGDKYEVIAGNRRFRAAKKAGLAEIPANVVEMDDIQAMEAQIVENLQREDVHPLEEGEAYRKLIEESKYDYESVAAKVGKSESYVKQRLFLTNLESKPAGAYRSGKILDGHAVLIAKLSPGDQAVALRAITEGYTVMTVKELKEWIERYIYSPLDEQPWLKNPDAAEAVGKCKECKPERASLFGEVKEGACTDLKCWGRKMTAYIDWMAKEQNLMKISSEYGQAGKGIKGRSEYVVVAKKGKDRCDSTHGAIVAEGADVGKTFDICSDANCKIHRPGYSEYRKSPAEKAKEKKQREAEAKRKEREEKEFIAELSKIKFPVPEKLIDALLWLIIDEQGPMFTRPIAKRNGIEAKEISRKNWEGKMVKEKDFGAGILEAAGKMDSSGKTRLLIEALLAKTYKDKKKFFSRI